MRLLRDSLSNGTGIIFCRFLEVEVLVSVAPGTGLGLQLESSRVEAWEGIGRGN